MTAHAMQGDRDRCLMAGMDDYIAKPIKPVELYGVIDRVAGGSDDEAPEEAGRESVIDFGADTSVADLQATRELLDGDEIALQQLIGLFFGDLDRNRKTLEVAVRTADCPSVRNVAHSIKGAAGVFNAVAVVASAQRLEIAGKESDVAAVRREFPVLMDELGKLAGVLRRARTS